MKQRFGVFATLVFGVVLGFPVAIWAGRLVDSTEGLTITVKVLNSAKVPSVILQKGQAVAGEIFREAGIELRWTQCPCEPSPDVMSFYLRIIPKLFGSTMSEFRSDHLGFAAVNEEGGELATIFYDRIESQTRGGDPSSLLGLATAHELGHLLLGSNAHTDEGIMRPRWTREDRSPAHRGSFRFSPEQSQTMRHRLVKSLALANGLAAESVRPGPRRERNGVLGGSGSWTARLAPILHCAK